VKSKIVTRKIILLFTLVAGVVAFPLAASAQSDAIPSWIKNTAGGQTIRFLRQNLSTQWNI